eukprot:COSAG01_NODE_4064_length_5387_cov_3.329236_4_plen_187_part_00
MWRAPAHSRSLCCRSVAPSSSQSVRATKDLQQQQRRRQQQARTHCHRRHEATRPAHIIESPCLGICMHSDLIIIIKAPNCHRRHEALRPPPVADIAHIAGARALQASPAPQVVAPAPTAPEYAALSGSQLPGALADSLLPTSACYACARMLATLPARTQLGINLPRSYVGIAGASPLKFGRVDTGM